MTKTTDSTKKHPNAASDDGNESLASKAVQNAALDYVKNLRENNPAQYERPQVEPMEEVDRKCHPIKVIRNAAREELKKLGKANKAQDEALKTRTEQFQTLTSDAAVLPRAELGASSASLPPRDSPLTKVFLGQYLSLLVQETITLRKTRYIELAQEMAIPEIVLQDAIQGKLGLTRGQWVKLGQLLSMPTAFDQRPSERDAKPCWELCYPPIRVGQPMQWW